MRTDRYFMAKPRMATATIGGYGLGGMKRAILPISVSHLQPRATSLGIRTGGRGVLLLSDGLGATDIQGQGFGMKSPNPALLDKLQSLQLKSVQGKLPKKKNVSLTL